MQHPRTRPDNDNIGHFVNNEVQEASVFYTPLSMKDLEHLFASLIVDILAPSFIHNFCKNDVFLQLLDTSDDDRTTVPGYCTQTSDTASVQSEPKTRCEQIVETVALALNQAYIAKLSLINAAQTDDMFELCCSTSNVDTKTFLLILRDVGTHIGNLRNMVDWHDFPELRKWINNVIRILL